ncbi:hypothetical protein [Massilibacteroides vaginae]|uniref:hypothetical protein n=1 Tax=Massilibacteroides vaginae TaxID=1673718 RepID=UPI000A1CE265|nr:hypothetical protein [Massilibacteroides vaginae]
MKKNFKFSALVAMALMAGFSSCSNENEPTEISKETKSVTLKLDLSSPTTYADEASATGTTATLSNGYVYFVKTGGAIDRVVAMSLSPAPGEADINTIATAGHTETGVDGAVQTIYVVGNVPASLNATLSAATTLSAVETAVLAIADQATVANVTLQGQSGLSVSPTATNVYTATVTIKPVVSRFEIAQIEYDNSTAASLVDPITGFSVEGIFVNNTYRAMQFDGTVSSLLYNGPTAAANFTAANYGSLADLGLPLGSSSVSSLTKVPNTTPGVWAYQFFPVDATAANPSPDALPELVIKLDNFTSTGGTITGTQWITIAQFKDASTGLVIDKFDANNIYKIANIKFDNSNLSATPSTTTKDITVYVTVQAWDTVNVDPVL